MKYVDADRLRKELNKWRDIQPTTVGLPRKATYEAMGVIQTIDHVLWLIDSLQQEQPDFPTTDEEIERLLATHPKVEVPQKYKTPDWLWKKQEQPEVDLEKEVEKYLLDNVDFITKSTSNEMVNALARHFAELGRKQVLQEIYEGKVKPVDKITATWLDDESKDKEDK